MAHTWFESYKVAILETDWTKMPQRLRSAEMEIQERQHTLSLDHGGSLEERRAIADALKGIKVLRSEATDWEKAKQSLGSDLT